MSNNLDIFGKERVLRWALFEDGAYHLTRRQLEIIGLDPVDYVSYLSRYDQYWIVPVHDKRLAAA